MRMSTVVNGNIKCNMWVRFSHYYNKDDTVPVSVGRTVCLLAEWGSIPHLPLKCKIMYEVIEHWVQYKQEKDRKEKAIKELDKFLAKLRKKNGQSESIISWVKNVHKQET